MFQFQMEVLESLVDAVNRCGAALESLVFLQKANADLPTITALDKIEKGLKTSADALKASVAAAKGSH